MTTLQSWINLIQTLVLTVTLIAAITQVVFLRRQIRAEHDWNRRSMSLNLTFCLDPNIRAVKSRLGKTLRLIDRQPGEIDLNEIQSLQKDDPKVREDLQFVLGRLEAMCVAISNGVADEKICKDIERKTLLRYFHSCRPYIDNIRTRTNNPKVYEFLAPYAAKWHNEDRPRPTGLPPHGIRSEHDLFPA